MIRRPPSSTRVRSSAASDVYKRQGLWCTTTGTFSRFRAPSRRPEAERRSAANYRSRYEAHTDDAAPVLGDSRVMRIHRCAAMLAAASALFLTGCGGDQRRASESGIDGTGSVTARPVAATTAVGPLEAAVSAPVTDPARRVY